MAKANEQLNERLHKIENSQQLATSQELDIKKDIKESKAEIAAYGILDKILSNTQGEKERLKHKEEELTLLHKDQEHAAKEMAKANPEIEQIQKIVKLEREQREKGDIKHADETARQAQEQIQTVLKETEGVSYSRKIPRSHARATKTLH